MNPINSHRSSDFDAHFSFLATSRRDAAWHGPGYARRLCSKAAVLLLATAPLLVGANSVSATVSNSDRLGIDESVRDPTARGRHYSNATEALINARNLRNSAAQAKGSDITRPANRSGLNDPTQMSDNFRQALQQLKVHTKTTQLKSTNNLPPFPQVSLAAIVYGENEEAFSMLHVGKRTVLVRVGDKASFVDQNKVIDLVVKEINRNEVHLAVYPANETIILR